MADLPPTVPARPTRILVVDDDPAFQRLISLALRAAGVEHTAVGTVKEALQLLGAGAAAASFDLILLDLELPGMKGWELLRLLRDSGRDIPVVLVTVLDDVQAKVRVLDMGADDYIVKPCSFEEVLSRVQAILRRGPARGRIRVGDLELDPLLRRVRRNGRTIDLTPREFELLRLLAVEPGRVLSQAEILRRAWNLSSEPSTNFLQVHLSRLKKKLAPMDRARIETVHGSGYRLVDTRAEAGRSAP
jgi:DNA-binding response OmpR family regulator